MKYLQKFKRILFVLILINSSASFAATFNFHIINSSDSLVNPITITKGSVSVLSGNASPACASKEIPFTSNIKVTQRQETILSYDIEYPAECYSNGGVYAWMSIVTVDGKSIYSNYCLVPGSLNTDNPSYDPNAKNINAGTVKITEMSDRFLCEFPNGALKG
jgi:hypothetical protein